jgi:phosphohistidine swiveling domain-containing protein
MSHATEAGPIQLPIPEAFPVEWDDPADADRLWQREVMHVPTQTTVLDDDLQRIIIDEGFNVACAAYQMPVRNAYRRINTYVYQSIAPVSHDPVVLEELGRKAGENFAAAIGSQLQRWTDESLPELERMYDAFESLDFDGSPSAAADTLDAAVDLMRRAWVIHFRTVFPVIISMSLFQDFHDELLGSEDGFEAYSLLQGQDNKSLEADRALHALSRSAQTKPFVLDVLGRAGAADVRAELASDEEGRAFLAELDEYLERWGKRLRLYITFSEPSFIEDPAPVIMTLKDAVTRPDEDHEAELARLAAERDALTAAARERLTGLPEAVREQFECLLSAARQGSVIQENHNFAIDCRINYEVRRALLAAGRRLASEGVIDDAGGVFHLRLEELRQALAGPVPADLGTRVAQRRDELSRWAGAQWPPVLGTLPPGGPPDDLIGRAVARMFGAVPRESESPDVLHGMRGSPGVATGTARVLRSLGEAERLEAGDILVTETTAPPWTLLFARAAAIVTDAGGILSHCAVVAREYCIPAVVGTKIGTSTIRDGQRLEVDGTNGTVRIVGE